MHFRAFVILLLFCQPILAQQSVHISDEEVSLENTLSYLKDSTLNVSPEKAFQLYSQKKFISLEKPYKNFGYTESNFWFGFQLKNEGFEQKKLILELQHSHLYEVELFWIENGKIQSSGRTGINYPFDKRIIKTHQFAFNIDLKPTQSQTYIVFVSRRMEDLTISFKLCDAQIFAKNNYQEYATTGIFVGIMLIMALFSLFLLISLREEIHLYYLFFVISVTLFYLADRGLGFQYLWSKSPPFNQAARDLFSALFAAIQIQFLQTFVGQTASNSRYFRIFNFLKYYGLVVAFFIFLKILGVISYTKFQLNIYQVMQLLMGLMILVIAVLTLIEKYRQGVKLALFYLVVLSYYIVWVVIVIFIRSGILQQNIFPPYILATGILFEAVFLAFGLSYRYNLFKKQNENLLVNLNKTQQETAQQVIAAQENERKRIAQDLHDEVGGTLGTIKGMLSSIDFKDEKFQESLKLLDKAHQDLRNISHNLMPPEFEYFGLTRSLSDSLEKLQQAYPTIKFDFLVTGNELRLKPEIELNIYRIISELLNNIVKHSKATTATVQLNYHTDEIIMMVEDNGVGIKNNLEDSSGIGLKNLNSRAKYIGANLVFDSNQFGTTVVLEFLLSSENFYETQNPDS